MYIEGVWYGIRVDMYGKVIVCGVVFTPKGSKRKESVIVLFRGVAGFAPGGDVIFAQIFSLLDFSGEDGRVRRRVEMT